MEMIDAHAWNAMLYPKHRLQTAEMKCYTMEMIGEYVGCFIFKNFLDHAAL